MDRILGLFELFLWQPHILEAWWVEALNAFKDTNHGPKIKLLDHILEVSWAEILGLSDEVEHQLKLVSVRSIHTGRVIEVRASQVF